MLRWFRCAPHYWKHHAYSPPLAVEWFLFHGGKKTTDSLLALKYRDICSILRSCDCSKVCEIKRYQAFCQPHQCLSMLSDIYTGAMTGVLHDSLIAQSWRRVQFGMLKADCISRHTVQDVAAITLRINKTSSISFPYNNDHSKYAIALHNGMFCFSSLNRGVSFCFANGSNKVMDNVSTDTPKNKTKRSQNINALTKNRSYKNEV